MFCLNWFLLKILNTVLISDVYKHYWCKQKGFSNLRMKFAVVPGFSFYTHSSGTWTRMQSFNWLYSKCFQWSLWSCSLQVYCRQIITAHSQDWRSGMFSSQVVMSVTGSCLALKQGFVQWEDGVEEVDV